MNCRKKIKKEPKYLQGKIRSAEKRETLKYKIKRGKYISQGELERIKKGKL